jgi:signal transduction histidine kinase
MIELPDNASRLLTRQINKSFPEGQLSSENFNKFLELISDGYIATENERVLYNRAEQIANQELQGINKALQIKNNFLDTFNHGMAHDIKNHTSNITGLVMMLKKYSVKEDLEMIHTITEKLELSAHQLNAIMEGFLYFSREEANEIKNYKPIKPDDLVSIIDTETNYLKAGKNIEFNYQFGNEEIVYSIHVLRIILVNLVSNSIKYSKQTGEAKIDVTVVKVENEIRITIADDGLGIDLTKHKGLYNLFHQASEPEAKGFGVGLHLVKKIVERKEGEMKLDTEIGKGTKITIKLPISN